MKYSVKIWAIGLLVFLCSFQALAEPQKPIIIAVFDTGLDLSHKYFEDHLWVNSGEIAGNNIDDDSNGYIDDIHGFNFRNHNGDVNDDAHNGHGTHMAGLVLGAHKTDHPALNIKLMILKMHPQRPGDSLLKALNYAHAHGASIFHMSLSIEKTVQFSRKQIMNMSEAEQKKSLNLLADYYRYHFYEAPSASDGFVNVFMDFQNRLWTQWAEAVSKIRDLENKMLIVAAAGNENSNVDEGIIEPASLPYQNILTVMSLNSNLQRDLHDKHSSNYGEHSVHVSAIGADTYTTAPYHMSDTGFKRASGTSVAAAKITHECIAVIAKFHQENHLFFTPRQLKERLYERLSYADHLDDLTITGRYLAE